MISHERASGGIRRYYLAGPMRNLPLYNFPQFRRVAALLREQGYEIISPAELDSTAIQTEAMRSKTGGECDRHGGMGGETMGEILGRDVRILHDSAHGMIFLPNWERSRGARLEAFVGLLQKDFAFLRWQDNESRAVPMSRRMVQDEIHMAWES